MSVLPKKGSYFTGLLLPHLFKQTCLKRGILWWTISYVLPAWVKGICLSNAIRGAFAISVSTITPTCFHTNQSQGQHERRPIQAQQISASNESKSRDVSSSALVCREVWNNGTSTQQISSMVLPVWLSNASMDRKIVKRYGIIFTCLIFRAVHLEVLEGMIMNVFINCLHGSALTAIGISCRNF